MEVQTFLIRTTPILAAFLNDTLPMICENWWEECVLSKLSENQKRNVIDSNIYVLEKLDIAALLGILDKNWNEISLFKNMKFEFRNYVKELRSIRNRYAHLAAIPFSRDDIFRDVDTIQRFVKEIDKENELIEDIQQYKELIFNIKSDISVEKFEINYPKIEKKIDTVKDEPIGKLVERYIPVIIKYCFNNDESEFIKLRNRDISNKLFGINYPFLTEVNLDSEKINRYWKTKYSYNNRHFVITSEWYKRNRKKFINYLNERNLILSDDIQYFVSDLEKLLHNQTEKSEGIVSEIKKVYKRIPKWFRSPKQINHKILVKYLELLEKNEFVYYSELEQQFQSIKNFKGHFYQMKNKGEHNHAKVFDEINGKVYLWEPVKEFILKSYKST